MSPDGRPKTVVDSKLLFYLLLFIVVVVFIPLLVIKSSGGLKLYKVNQVCQVDDGIIIYTP